MAQGAEAKILDCGSEIKKYRFPKKYRLAEIDTKLRGFRTRREAKILVKLAEIDFPAPRLVSSDDAEKIVMQKLQGRLLKEIFAFADTPRENRVHQIGKNCAALHTAGIIHGDLTTSNMILVSETVYFIDFGLSFFSQKPEDRAVDLHVLQEGLMALHSTIGQNFFEKIIAAYRAYAPDADATLARLAVVEKRGRYRLRKGG